MPKTNKERFRMLEANLKASSSPFLWRVSAKTGMKATDSEPKIRIWKSRSGRRKAAKKMAASVVSKFWTNKRSRTRPRILEAKTAIIRMVAPDRMLFWRAANRFRKDLTITAKGIKST